MIDVAQLSVVAGTFALSNVSFHVPSGSYAVLMGQTGSGKTTLLEAICGLKEVRGGAIRLDGRDVTRLAPGERGIGFVPQDGALFPTLTVREHLEFALIFRHRPPAEIAARVEDLAKRLRLAELLDRHPWNLSGGERQRVALGRALSFSPRILCLDEPLSALDDDTREDLLALLKSVQRDLGVTLLHVTHNRHEAERVADLRLRLEAGQIVSA